MLWGTINATCLGGKVERADVREYGKSHLIVSKEISFINRCA